LSVIQFVGMSQFLELLSQRCVYHDDATSSDYVTSSGGRSASCGRTSFCGLRHYPAGFVGGLRKTTKSILNRNSRYPRQHFDWRTWELSDARPKSYSLAPFDFPSGIFPECPLCACSCYRFSHEQFRDSHSFAAVSLPYLLYSTLRSECQQ